MKKLLAMILLLSLALAGPGCAETRVLGMDQVPYVNQMLSDGGALLLFGDALYVLRDGAEAPEVYTDAVALPREETDDWRAGFGGLGFYLDGGRLRGWKLVKNGGEAEALLLCDVVLSDGEVRAENVRTHRLPKALKALDIDAINTLFAQDGAYYLLIEDFDGAHVAYVTADDCRVEPLEGWDHRLFPGGDGAWLTFEDDAGEATRVFRFGADGALTPLFDLPREARALAADPAGSRLIVAHEGSLYAADVRTGDMGAPLAALTLTNIDGGALLAGDRCAVSAGSGVVILDLSGDAGQTPLVIRGDNNLPGWTERAMLDFIAGHPDIAPSYTYLDEGRMLDDVLTRSDAVDIYVLPVDSPQYEALRQRGYLLPLDGSAALSGLIGGTAPALREALSSDGHPAALPLYAEGHSLGFGEPLLEKMGLALSDVPADWSGLLDFIENTLPEYVDRLGPGDRRAYEGLTPNTLRDVLFTQILYDWVYAARAKGEIPDYEAPALVSALERLESMRFEALALDEDIERDEDDFFGGGYSYGGGDYLFCLDLDTGFLEYNDYNAGTPVLPGFEPGESGPLALKLTAAFVNPYGPHREAAVAWLEAMADAMPAHLRMTLCPDLAEATRWPDAEETLAWYEAALADAQAQIDAAEPAERQALEEARTELERDYADFRERGVWWISQARADWYRAHADAIVPACATWFEQDASGEAGNLVRQYRDGQISLRDFLADLNRKARMMALEQG